MRRFLLFIIGFVISILVHFQTLSNSIDGNTIPKIKIVEKIESSKPALFLPNLPSFVSTQPSRNIAPNQYQFKQQREFDILSRFVPEQPDEFRVSDYAAPSSEDIRHRERAHTLLDLVEKQQRFVDVIDASTVLHLPVGIKKTIGNLDYIVLIDSMVLTPTHAYLVAYMSFEIPQNGKKLAFRGTNIRFSKTGGLDGTARLELLGNQPVPMGDNTLMLFRGDGSTFVEWDCNGFNSMGIGADIEFSRNLFLPDVSDPEQGTERVRARFQTVLSNWNDLIAEVTIDPFQVKGLNGVGFSVSSAVIDYSDQRNPLNLIFPEGYMSTMSAEGAPELWQGFYLKEATVRLPEQFRNRGTTDRITFTAYDVLIDQMGFSGTLSVNNLIRLAEGDMNGWSYSVDNLAIEVQANQLIAGGFGGNINVPITQEDQTFEYSAFINPGDEYVFAVSPAEELAFPLWQAGEVSLYDASYLEIRVEERQFLPKAHLHGRMSVGVGEEKLTLAHLEFQALEVQTVSPYVQIGAFSLGTSKRDQTLGGFGLSVNNVGASSPNEDELALNVDVTLNLVGEDGGGFGATAGLSVVGKTIQQDQRQRWQYERVDMSKFGVAVSTGAVKIQGSLAWFKKDITYGDGIRGDAEVDIIDKINVKAVALFGKQQDTRYWFADALAALPPGAGTGIQFKSFGGGASYHMKAAARGGSPLGESLSGLTYLPDARTGLGVRAMVDIATAGSDKIFNGDASLEISFNARGGLNKVQLRGNGYFMTPALELDMVGLRERTGKLISNVSNAALNVWQPKAQVSAAVDISYDVPGKTFHGNFEVFVNVAGGIMKGVGQRNRAGWAVLHFSPDEWYVHVGSPDDPLGIQILKVVKTESYFMAGDYIPGSPPPPDNVSEILGGTDLNYMDELNELGEGKGVAFGSRFNMDTGDLSFLMFYARFAAGMGFDVMVKDYGNLTCDGANGPIGINGWYANGQVFAYMQGEIGIKVKVFGKKRQYEILSIGAAAALQAKLPNPFWMKGTVGGNYSVLGGLVKGNCKFEVTVGEECEITGGSVLEGIVVISEVTPNFGEKDVSVFNAPQGVFNMEIGKVFEMVDIDDQKKSFRIKLDHFKVLEGTREIPGSLEWNDDLTVLAFNSIDVLPPQKTLKASVQISFEELINGAWRPVIDQGQRITEKKVTNFTTGVAPDYIPLSNVAYCYPLVNQYNFYKNESSKGYIKLKKGQPYLFEVSDEWIQKGRFLSGSGDKRLFDFRYSNLQVNFTIPSGLKNNEVYAFELVNMPATDSKAIDANVDSVRTSLSSSVAIDAEMKTNQAEGTLMVLEEKSIFSTHVRTSRYATLRAKLDRASFHPGIRGAIEGNVHELRTMMTHDEYFDAYEIHGNPTYQVDSLVQFAADLTNNRYYQDYIYPLIYEGYPLRNVGIITWRDLNVLGLAPSKAMYIRQMPDDQLLSEADISGNATSPTVNNAKFVYNLIHYYARDYAEIQQKVATYFAIGGRTPTDRESYLLATPFPKVKKGTYDFTIYYSIPQLLQWGSSKNITITNPVH